jgi:hypothetical protein
MGSGYGTANRDETFENQRETQSEELAIGKADPRILHLLLMAIATPLKQGHS